MPAGLMDTGFSDALTRGLSLGLQFTTAREQREARKAKDAQDAREFEERKAQNRASNDIRSGQLSLALAKITEQSRQREADQALNLSRFDQLDQRPDPNFVGPVDPSHPAPMQSGLLGIDREAFANASPSAQTASLAPTLADMRTRRAAEIAADTRRLFEEQQLQSGIEYIEASKLPRAIKDKAIFRLRLRFSPDGEDQTVTLADWQSQPIRGMLSPDVQKYTDALVTTTGKLPPTSVLDDVIKQSMGLAPQPRLTNSNPEVFRINTQLQIANNNTQTATMQYRVAKERFNGFLRSRGMNSDFFRKSPQQYTPSDMQMIRQMREFEKQVTEAQSRMVEAVNAENELLRQKGEIAQTLGPRPHAMPQAPPQPGSTAPGPQMQTPTNPNAAAVPSAAMRQRVGGLAEAAIGMNPDATDDELEELIMQLLNEDTPADEDQP